MTVFRMEPVTKQKEVLEIQRKIFGGKKFVILTAEPVRYNWSVADMEELTDESI